MRNHICYGDDILARTKSPAIKALYIKWKTLSQLKRVTLSDFFEPAAKTLDRLVVLLCVGDDYAFVYYGEAFRAAIGHDLSGKLLSEVDTRVGREMREIYDQVRETRMPVRFTFASEGVKSAVGWERILVPIVVADEVRMLVSYAEALNTAADVHDYLFGSSPHLLIVAMPIAYGGEIVDADVLQLNPIATRFFGTASFTERPIRLRALSPWFDDDTTWSTMTGTSDTIQREHLVVDPRSGSTFKSIVVRLEHLLLVRLFLVEAAEMATIE